MRSDIAAIWRRPPSDLDLRLDDRLRSGCDKAEARRPLSLFFRADDVAVPGKNFSRLMDLFAKYGVPLSLAIVPAWLTPPRWQYLNSFEKKNPFRWCWHQHGWRHANHETEGKKQEFGDARSLAQITQDIARGKHRLEQLMAGAFYPVFTPPWNRCSADALQALKALGYAAVSRSPGSKPRAPRGLPDFSANLDLHTRKERDPAAGWHNLLRELEQAVASGFCGIMLHHQLMNPAAFDFLEILLKALTKTPAIQIMNFKGLVGRKIS
jgi:peptidoglycan/xylan/chitin deacetylase (PgdA/CDA1 family)